MDANACSVGIMAFNEEENIEFLLQDVLRQETEGFLIVEVIVVVSGCTDRTQDIVKKMQDKNNRIRLLIQEEREGKASAINLFLSQANGAYVVLISADVRINSKTIKKILEPLRNSHVGMAGGRIVPVNRSDTFMGYGVQLMWQLCHQLSHVKPKLGEMVAFKNIVREIPRETAVDEAYLEAFFSKQNLTLAYVPDALVYNKGPETIKEFLSQRQRIFIGHLWIRKRFHYSVSSLDVSLIAGLVAKNITSNPQHFFWTVGLLFLEVVARLRGSLAFLISRRNPYMWDRINTSKSLTAV